jgi:Fe-S oxidoreductase
MYSPSALSYALLGLLIVGALAGLALGLRRRLARIAAGRATPGGAAEEGEGAKDDEGNAASDPDAQPLALGRPFNAKAFVQRAVFTERLWKRPVAGTAHALLFFGAIVAILGHAAYGLELFGVDVYDAAWVSWLTRWGREFAGIAMLLGAAFFLVRRASRLPRLLVGGERRGFTPMEALLLATIVAGFVTEAFRLAIPGQNRGGEFLGAALGRLLSGMDVAALGTGNMLMWWGHGLLGLAFIALIGWTPMSHLLVGPANSALARRRSGIQMPPIDFDDDNAVLGAAKLADFQGKVLLDFEACVGCGRCHEVCPAAQTGKALSPKQVMMTGAAYLREGRADDAQLIDDIGAEAIFDCTTCAACVEACPVSNSPAEAILEFRRHLVLERSEMPDTLAAMNRNLESRGHAFVGTAANPDDWHKGLDVPLFEAGTTEYLLWIGCAVRYEESAQQVARAMVRILNAAGVSFGILGEARCTGDPAKMGGNEMQFVDMARDNIEAFQERKIQKVITLCAHCFNSFDRYYPELGADWQTTPHSVLIEQLIADGRLKVARDAAESITFHDPCYLARHNDIVDEPRRVLESIGSLIEMPRNRKDSMCCGAGGCNYWARSKPGTQRINDVRTKEALDTGAKKIATSCSFCLLMLQSSVPSDGPRRVFDIAELVAEALPDASTPAPVQEKAS